MICSLIRPSTVWDCLYIADLNACSTVGSSVWNRACATPVLPPGSMPMIARTFSIVIDLHQVLQHRDRCSWVVHVPVCDALDYHVQRQQPSHPSELRTCLVFISIVVVRDCRMLPADSAPIGRMQVFGVFTGNGGSILMGRVHSLPVGWEPEPLFTTPTPEGTTCPLSRAGRSIPDHWAASSPLQESAWSALHANRAPNR